MKISSGVRKRLEFAGLGILAAGTGLAVFVATVPDRQAPPVSDTVAAYAAQTPSAPKAADVLAPEVSVADAMSRLKDADRPFTIAILGDSTGAPADGWVPILAEHVGTESSRTVTYHSWTLATDPAGYVPARNVTEGVGAAVTVWNGSAAGQDPTYTLAHLDAMVPVDPATVDLVLVNHGHNAKPGTLTTQADALIREAIGRFTSAAFVVMTQNPERAGYANAAPHNANMDKFAAYATYHQIPVIDVRAAFQKAPDLGALLADDVHPNADGYRVWADAVIEALPVP